jgi:MYXO-CTERM domain-containing protein
MPWTRICLVFLVALLQGALLLGCGTEPTPDSSSQQATNTTVEFQDIFIPERLIELPVLPEGTEVVNEIFVHNAGDRDLTIDEVSLNYQSDLNWELVEDSVPTVITPHEHAVVQVIYTAAAEVDTFAALDIYSDDPDEAEKTVAFIGHQATGGPLATVSQQIMDWGFQFRGEEERKILQVRNTGDEPLAILGVEMIQSEAQPAFSIACPGQPLDSCDWETEQLPLLLQDPILPGSGALLDLTFIPLNLQSVSAQLKIQTSDPLRPEFTIFLLGNGESALNCTAPSITVTSPAEATFYHDWQELVVTARVNDQEQPSNSMYVEMFLGDLFIEDEFPDDNGFITFVIDIDEHNPPLPSGLQPFTLKVTDGCPLFGYATFVAAIDFPLSSSDIDGDGFDQNQGDCNDNNPDVFPQNVEVLDGLDNNCDGSIDEDTAVWDDDCDGYCESPPCNGQGPSPDPTTLCTGLAADSSTLSDCNDSVADLDGDGVVDGATISPAAEEMLNFVDDNCNSITDEGTSFFDDDGDGQTEAVGDCNDDDAEVFNGATEWCDQVDNDCNGQIDDSCIDQTAPPRVIGGVICSQFQVQLGDRIPCEILVVSQDDNLTFEWFTDMGAYFDDPATAATVFWNAPEDNDDNGGLDGEFPTIMVTVTDGLGQQAYGFGNVLIRNEIQTSYAAIDPNAGSNNDNCSTAGRSSSPGWLFLVLLSGAALRRRRG